MHMVKHNKNKWMKIANGGRHTELKKEIGVAGVGENVTEERGNLEKKTSISVRHFKWEKHLPKKYVFRWALIFSCSVNFLIINVEVQWAKTRNDKLKKTPHWLSMVSCLCCCWMWWIFRYTSMHICTRIVYIPFHLHEPLWY